MKYKILIASALCTLLLLVLALVWWQVQSKDKLSISYSYLCPMHPHIVSEKKGSCPICGMDLVLQEESPKPSQHGKHKEHEEYEEHEEQEKHQKGMKVEMQAKTLQTAETLSSHTSFYLPLERQQKIGVRLEKVQKRHLFKSVKAPGRIAFDPELYAVQGEYIESLKQWQRIKKSPLKELRESTREMIQSAKVRLKVLGLSDEQIEKLSQKKYPSTGLLISGSWQERWIYAEVFEMDLPSIRKDLEVEVSAPFFGGRVLSAKVVSMDRVINPRTRTAKVRIQLTKITKNIQLRPEAYVDVTIRIPMGKHLSISREAMMDTGRELFVFVKKGEGSFEPKKIHVLFMTEEYLALKKDALDEEDEVVVGANFMLDSESRLRSVLKKKTDHLKNPKKKEVQVDDF